MSDKGRKIGNVCIALGLALASVFLVPYPPVDSNIKEFPLNTGGYAAALTAGPDGNIWISQGYAGLVPEKKIARMTPKGNVKEFTVSRSPSDELGQLVAGPDGNLWFAVLSGRLPTDTGKIGRLAPRGKVTMFEVPGGRSGLPGELASGNDGGVWFTFARTNGKVARISPSGEITEFALPSPHRSVRGITLGPDGNIWYTSSGDRHNSLVVGRITKDGDTQEFPLPNSMGGSPGEIALGGDGNLWFTHRSGTVRMTPRGDFRAFGTGTSTKQANRACGKGSLIATDIASGSDGDLYFSEEVTIPRLGPMGPKLQGCLGRVTTSGRVTHFRIPNRQVSVLEITTGPGRTIWYGHVSAVGRLSIQSSPKA